MHDLNAIYQEVKWWLPMLSAIAVVWKVKNAFTGYADQLLNNHLHSIQEATQSTVTETVKTNSLLTDNNGKLIMLQNTVAEHNEKEAIVWAGVVNTLSIIEDRTRRAGTARKAAHAKK